MYLIYFPFQPPPVLPARLYWTLRPAHHPMLLYWYLASVASNATWWLPHMESDFPTSIRSRSTIILWSRINQILSEYHVLFWSMIASLRRSIKPVPDLIAWASRCLWYHHSVVDTTSSMIPYESLICSRSHNSLRVDLVAYKPLEPSCI